MLTRHFWEKQDNREFLTFTYKELLKKFLGGRCQSIRLAFFQSVFEACPCLGWSIVKSILRCVLTKDASDKADIGEDETGPRSNHQRIQAVEMLAMLIKSSTTTEALDHLAKQFPLLTSVIVRVVLSCDSW